MTTPKTPSLRKNPLKGYDRSLSRERGEDKLDELMETAYTYGMVNARIMSEIWECSVRTAENTLQRHTKNGWLNCDDNKNLVGNFYWPTPKMLSNITEQLPQELQKAPPHTAESKVSRTHLHDLTLIHLVRKTYHTFLLPIFEADEDEILEVYVVPGRYYSKIESNKYRSTIPDAVTVVKVRDVEKNACTYRCAIEMQCSGQGTHHERGDEVAHRISRYYTHFENSNYDWMVLGYVTDDVKKAYKDRTNDDVKKKTFEVYDPLTGKGHWRTGDSFENQHTLRERIKLIDVSTFYDAIKVPVRRTVRKKTMGV